jgi:seryl-tRNA synthetase
MAGLDIPACDLPAFLAWRARLRLPAMHDIRLIRDDPAAFDLGLKRRGLPPRAAELIGMDERRRAAILALQALQERRNAASKEIGQAMGRKDAAAAASLKEEVAAIKARMPELEAEEKAALIALDGELAAIPNLPAADTPDGADENDNVEIRRHGAPPAFPEGFAPKEHFEIGEALGLMDFETASKISGARFVVLKGALARLERALAQFMLDLHTDEHGYQEVSPPVLVRDHAVYGTAQLPKSREDMFHASRLRSLEEGNSAAKKQILVSLESEVVRLGFLDLDDFFEKSERFTQVEVLLHLAEKVGPDSFVERLWLVPTAEVPLTNLARESIIDEAKLPLRFTAGTPSFRAEAGAAGRDTRGMIRQHQFFKVELVSITTAEQAAAEHERMTNCAEEVLTRLGLHHRTMALCAGDMGFAARKTYDLEVWLPGQGRFREISSCSVCGDFQARRMNARSRAADAKATRFVHTLNGSGVAVGRALVAVLENYQNPDGSVTVPAALRRYMGGMERIERAS